MKIAIITVNYNGKKDTLELLRSFSILPTTNYQLLTIVVDNASSDGSVSEIKKSFPETDILQTGENLGFSGGYNKGLDYANIWGADYFLLINNDCLIKDPNLISELVKIAQSDPKIGLVSPKIYFAKGFEFQKGRYQEEDLGKVIWYAGGQFDWDNIVSIHRGIDEVDKGQYDDVSEVEFISGACVLIKKEVIERIGLFDEKYFLYFEDGDFIKRARDDGFKIYYDGQVAVYHKVSSSTGIGSKITDYYHTRNRLIFGMQYGRLRTRFALVREAVKLLIFGRSTQRRGISDFYLGVTGHNPGLNKDKPGLNFGIEYPLKLSIGIVNYNTPDLTKKLLKSIFDKDSGFDEKTMEVIVLDNGLTNPCKDAIKEFLPKIKYLENLDNEGFTKGYNKTIKFSLGEYYLMFNSDIEVLKNGISELVKVEDEFEGKAVLGGKLLFPDGSDQDSAFHLPTLTGAIKEYFFALKGAYFMYLPTSPGRSQSPPSRWIRVEGLVMACLLIPKKILNQVGLLNEETFIFFEDIEYARRLKKFKIPVYYVPAAKFMHHHGGSTKKIGQEKANEHLIESSKHYHGKFYYTLLSFVLRLGQKFGRVKTPVARWKKSN
ncbi:MAG: glycosyltransferase family 2 protein [Candidatus Daviesbacteria bacterium]|nr:glycosyltransferase family 2 protein [Candidatus Daviesbacteria bacterium]